MSVAEEQGAAGPVTLDAFVGGRFEMVQPAKGYRAGSDALLLAAAVPACAGERVLEAGIGTAAAALSLATRVGAVHVTGLETDEAHARLARENAARNGLADAIDVRLFDVAEATAEGLRSLGIAPGFDHAMANPPYHEEGRARLPQTASRRAGHIAAQGLCGLWVARMADAVRGGGTVTMIHRATALPELIAAFTRHLGGVVIVPVAARAGEDASRVIVQARKGSRAGVRLASALILHDMDASPSASAELILRDGAGIDLSATPVTVRCGGGGANGQEDMS